MDEILTPEQLDKAKRFIYKNGRLLERKLFEYFFENGSNQACLKALSAYQNEDGGFGNGIEPDLLCPDSTAIGAETAMYVLDLLNCYKTDIVDKLVDWIATHQNADGFIPHPPENLDRYPYQPWWKNPDKERILSLAGLLKKWGIDQPAFFERARSFYLSVKLPEEVSFYDYPFFVYLKYCSESAEDKIKLSSMIERLPALISKYRDHFPLFSRAWFCANDYVNEEVLAREASFFMNAMQEDSGINTPYPDFPWWRPLFLLDGLVLLKKMAFL